MKSAPEAVHHSNGTCRKASSWYRLWYTSISSSLMASGPSRMWIPLSCLARFSLRTCLSIAGRLRRTGLSKLAMRLISDDVRRLIPPLRVWNRAWQTEQAPAR